MAVLSSESGLWREEFKIHSYDVDLKQRITLEAVSRYFLEAAWNHAEALGVGYSQLEQQNRIWVMARLLMKISRYPRWGDTMVLTTWPRASKSVLAMRDFQIADFSGKPVLGGASAWLVLGARSRKPQRIDKLLSTIG